VRRAGLDDRDLAGAERQLLAADLQRQGALGDGEALALRRVDVRAATAPPGWTSVSTTTASPSVSAEWRGR
jgi:hypothetical protein